MLIHRFEMRLVCLYTKEILDHLECIALFCIPTDFQMVWAVTTQLIHSNWPVNSLGGLNLRAQESGLMSSGIVCAIGTAWLGTRLPENMVAKSVLN